MLLVTGAYIVGFRFFRRLKIAPGVSLNFSKSGISPSFGVAGARVTLGRQGVRKTVGVPGTGLFYTEVDSSSRRRGRSSGRGWRPSPPEPQHKLDLGFFERLLTPKAERAFVDGCKAYVAGNTGRAAGELRNAAHLADGAFLAGFLAINAERLADAEQFLKQALAKRQSLGRHFDKYGLAVELTLPIAEFVVAHVRPGRRGVLLGLAEVYQAQNRIKEALRCLKNLRRDDPDDAVVNLSVAELIMEAFPDDKRLAKEIVELAGGVENESSVHAALMLYKARALRTLGLPTAARDVLTPALRKTKNRDEDLLRAIRYERAGVYEDLGQKARARKEYEKLYAENPPYEDVSERLGLG
jgi:tetratricopeptide (TPR) repeat protein